jgi:hypothetical protein
VTSHQSLTLEPSDDVTSLGASAFSRLPQLDGAFVISDQGVVVSACRYLDATASNINLPLGLGSRHFAAASISKATRAVGIVVSESALVRVFNDGNLIAEVLPELWLLNRYSVQLPAPFSEEHFHDLAVLVSQDEPVEAQDMGQSSSRK